MSVLEITRENFQTEVMESDKPVLLDFWAEWCGPCMMLAPTIAEIAEENEDVKVCKVNVDEAPGLAAAYDIDAIPAVLVFRNGEITASAVGLRPKASYLDMLQ